MPHASSQAVAAKFHVGQRFTGIQFLVTMPQCRQVSQYIVNRREAERRPLFVRFMWCFPGRGDPEMEQRDCFDGRRDVFRWHDPRRPPSSARKRANENRVERRAHCYFTSEWRGADCVAIAGGNEIRVKTGIVEIDRRADPDSASSTSSSTIFCATRKLF